MGGVRGEQARRRTLGAAAVERRTRLTGCGAARGPQHVVLETAATDLAADLVGTRKVQVVSWHVMFMSRGKVGPFRVEGTAHAGRSGRVGVRMLLHDEGNADKPVTSAAAIFDVVG